jgi:hypothetical protein
VTAVVNEKFLGRLFGCRKQQGASLFLALAQLSHSSPNVASHRLHLSSFLFIQSNRTNNSLQVHHCLNVSFAPSLNTFCLVHASQEGLHWV